MSAPRIGLALSGGGARGFAHIAVMEALDDLGLRPAHVTGTSIGAILGAAYCAGMTGREIRHEILSIFRTRSEVLTRLMRSNGTGLGALVRPTLANPLQMNAERLLAAFLPASLPHSFEDLTTPMTVVATDFYRGVSVDFESGPLRKVIAASVAIPALFRPVVIDKTVYVDGGVVDPLPMSQFEGRADIIVAVDVVKGPTFKAGRIPTTFEAILGSSQMMMQNILNARVARHPPDVLIKPDISNFRILEFHRARAILKASEAFIDDSKRDIEAAIQRFEHAPVSAVPEKTT
ncbi:MAG: patatin-like phospholipase family protein [Rhodobiaceae bacterium]|nr:patatin-like phospholipase family protein [Rhodobiaceae bacterium]